MRVSQGDAWIKGYARGMTLLVLLCTVAMTAAGFSGSPQGTGQSFTPPTNVAATSSGGTITVSWTPGSGASSQVIVAVNVLDDTDYCLGFDATGGASSHECPELSSGETYVVLVIALDGAGGYRLGKDAQGNLVTHTLLSVPVSQEVGAGEAATVTHDSGAQLEVPAGALPEATTVSIAEVRPPASDIPVGRVYDFSVGEVELAQPATLRIPYQLSAGQPTELLYAVHWNEDAGEWERVEAEVDETTGAMVVTTAELSRFSYALVSVDATCSAEPDANNANRFTMTSSITSRTLFDVTVFMAPEASETTRGATFFDKSDVRSSSRTLSRKETRTFSESFSLRYVGDYEARCRIFWEVLGAEIELKQKGDDSIVIGVSQNAAPDRALSKLNECSSSAVDPVTGKTTRNFGNARTVLQGESLGFTANGSIYGRDKIPTKETVPHIVAAIAGHYDGELLDKSIGRKKPMQKNHSTIPLATTSFTFSEVGEYTIDCVLWWFLDDPKIPDFRNQTEESIKDLLRCILDGTACLGYLKALRDVRTVTVTAVPALWSQRPMEIEPAGGVPHDSPDSRATVRVYTRETTATGHVITPPTIVLTLRDNLGLTALPNRHRGRTSTCGTRGADFCWEATFDMPFNPAQVVLNSDGTITTNDLVYSVSVATDRSIRGAVPSGTAVVQSKPAFSTDRQLLGVLYAATSGGGWTNRQGWTSSTIDVGDWHGVGVDSDNRVSELEIYNNNLQGDLPAAIGLLGHLTRLDLSHNAGSGRAGLVGEIPTALGRLARLTHLDLSHNTLSGEIPPDLAYLSGLEALILSDNNLNGELPLWLGNLSNLENLDLADNGLSGTIPAALGDLASLEHVYLAGNDLSGCVPAGLRDLRNDDFDDLRLPYCDVALSNLSVSPWELEPAFEPHRLSYTAKVYDSQATIAPTSDHGATFEYGTGVVRLSDADASAPGFQVDLECGETTVEVRVISADGRDHTYTVEFESSAGAAPAAPAISRVSEGTGTLTAYWTAPVIEDCGGAIEYYNLRHSLDQDDAIWTEVRGPSNSLSYTIRGLTAGTTYRVQVQAVNEHGAGAWSETSTGTPRSGSTTQRPQPPQTGVSADYTVNEDAGSVGIAVTISESPQERTSLLLTTYDRQAESSQDYSALRIVVAFLPDSPLTQTFPIRIIDDRTVEGTETFQVHIEKLGIPLPPGIEEGRYATVAIVDDDTAAVSFETDQITVNEDGIAEIGVVMANTAGITCLVIIPVDVYFSYTDRDGALTSGSTIPSSATFGPCARRSVVPFNVDDVDGDAEVVFTLTRVSSSDVSVANRVTIAEPSTVTVTVRDTD